MPSLRRDDSFYWRGVKHPVLKPSKDYGKGRKCASCPTILSRYNEDLFCSVCIRAELKRYWYRYGKCPCGTALTKSRQTYCSRRCQEDAAYERMRPRYKRSA
jgi:hypothetical protein